MEFYEKRHAPRIGRERLPEQYGSYSVRLSGGLIEVRAYDASITGFGFISVLPSREFPIGAEVVAYPVGMEFPVHGVVRYATAVPGGTHVGLSLLVSGGLAFYRQVVSGLVPEA